jgi:hypothetical protein
VLKQRQDTVARKARQGKPVFEGERESLRTTSTNINHTAGEG